MNAQNKHTHIHTLKSQRLWTNWCRIFTCFTMPGTEFTTGKSKDRRILKKRRKHDIFASQSSIHYERPSKIHRKTPCTIVLSLATTLCLNHLTLFLFFFLSFFLRFWKYNRKPKCLWSTWFTAEFFIVFLCRLFWNSLTSWTISSTFGKFVLIESTNWSQTSFKANERNKKK